MHSPNLQHLRAGHERGAVLVTAMLLLLVLTVIGVTVMQLSRLQERMAGNSRDVNLSFQASEAALRSGEKYISDQESRPIPCSDGTCDVWLEGSLVGAIANKDADWWEENGKAFSLGTIEGLAEDPKAVVEELGFVRTDGGVVMGQDPPDGRDFYQVTARSTGGSGQAEIVLQSTYTRKF